MVLRRFGITLLLLAGILARSLLLSWMILGIWYSRVERAYSKLLDVYTQNIGAIEPNHTYRGEEQYYLYAILRMSSLLASVEW